MPSGQYNGEKIAWDDHKERHLLILILLQCNTSTVDWNLVASKFGDSVSVGAIRQKYGKIRARDAASFGMTDAGDAGTPKTPASGKRGRGKKAKPASDDDDGDNEEVETPVKKRAKTSAKVNLKPKDKEALQALVPEAASVAVKSEVTDDIEV